MFWLKHLNLDIIKRIIPTLRSLTFFSCRISSLGHAQRNYGSQLCDICLFKRRIIARDDLEHALYIIPVDKFHEVGNSSRLSVLTHYFSGMTNCMLPFYGNRFYLLIVTIFLLQVFPKIKKDEALVYHGTEFPIGQEHQNTSSNALHQQFLITDNLHVSFELLHGQNFSIVSPHTVCCENQSI